METRINAQIQSQNLRDSATLIDIMCKQAIEYDFNKGRMVINSILLADRTEINNRTFLLDKIRDYGCAYQGWNLYAPYQQYLNASDYGPLQIPTELADFLIFCIQKRPASFLEVGVLYGGFSVLCCAVLSKFNQDFRYICKLTTNDSNTPSIRTNYFLSSCAIAYRR
ncbi:hypothetical protein NIES932_12880 [Raphidiopsis curvata NIES-932]|nr:hypothetical protein NIES932_12880 [Raphidiopsis curvata NIES-932]